MWERSQTKGTMIPATDHPCRKVPDQQLPLCLIRTVAVLVKKKIACNSLARAVSKDDFQKFDYIFGM
jgi:hypothetical protein